MSRTRSGRQRAVLVLGGLATFLLVLGALSVFNVVNKLGLIEREEDLSLDQVEVSGEPINLLIVGSDSRDNIDPNDPNAALFLGGTDDVGGERADTMVVLRFDEANQRMDVLSIPRDLWLPIADTGENERINTAFSGGADRLIRTIQDELGIPIHHYAEVDFVGFQSLVDEVGGIPLYFETIYQDANSGFVVPQAGCVTLDGHMALAYVRSRNLEYMTAEGYWETDPTGDLGRISRQQLLIRAALAEARDKIGLTDLILDDDILDIAVGHVTLSEDLEPTILAAMGQRFAEFEGESIATHTLATEPYMTAGGASVLRLLEVESQGVLNVFRGLPMDDLDSSIFDVVVLNGSGIPGQAGEVQAALELAGFTIAEVGDVPRPVGEDLAVTDIRFGESAEAIASELESYLVAGAILQADDELGAGEIVLETGVDYAGVGSAPRVGPSPVATLDSVAGSSSRDPSESPGVDTPSTLYEGSPSTTGAITTTTGPIGHVPGSEAAPVC